ncbi:MAG: PilZ domain-containing protein [Deltaproteobacteria bacterium]
MEERREATRWEIVLPVDYLSHPEHKEGHAHTLDMSTRGAQLETLERHQSGDRIDVMFHTGEGMENNVCAEARVIWQRPAPDSLQECNYLTGIEFTKIRDCFKQKILDYVIDTKPEQVHKRWWGGSR